uniref:Uncharacterized protein n=1 Tax=Acanthochromis polyacanthus TaxID=80966 RepID=A0A3Q1ER55_9TELE
MSRLLLANEERDEALLRARRLQQDIDELIQQVHDADSGQDVHQFGSVLVERLRLARQRRNDITAQEMKAVMEERDRSVIKVSLVYAVHRVYYQNLQSAGFITHNSSGFIYHSLWEDRGGERETSRNEKR